MKQIIITIVSGACLSLGACASPAFYRAPLPLEVQADQLNRAAADAERLMIVRNVMRARDRNSMVFTRISSMRGSMSRSVETSVGASFDEGPSNDGATLGAQLSGESSPSFDLQIMNDDKFNRAIHSSIDSGVYHMLLEQGWPPHLLHTLFIERVDVRLNADGTDVSEAATPPVEPLPIVTLVNDPSDAIEYERFRTWLNSVLDNTGHRLQFCSSENPASFGPYIRVDASDLEAVVALAGAKLTLVEGADANAGRYRVTRPRTESNFGIGCPPATATAAPAPRSRRGAARSAADTPAQTPAVRSLNVQQERTIDVPTGSTPQAQVTPEANGPQENIHVRSIQGVLYYLGEVVRAQHGDNFTVKINQDAREAPLFEVREGRCPLGITFVHDDGQTYSIAYESATMHGPNTCSGGAVEAVASGAPQRHPSTNQVIALMLQLIGMVQLRDEGPTTQTVQVVN